MPYENKRSLKNIIDFIGVWQPDEVYQIGDLMDYPTPSRWSKGTREEYAQLVKEHSEYGKRSFLEPLRNVFDGPIGILEGNHDERPRVYLTKEAPALAEFQDVVRFENLLDFDGFGIEKIDAFHRVGPDTVLIHGHEIKGMSQIAGTSAYNHARKAGANVIMGHTHRLGIRRETHGNSTTGHVTRWGFEVGHIMDMAKAGYLGAGSVANWQQGFGLLYVGDFDVQPVEVDINRDGSFVVEGTRYGALKRGAGGRFAKAS
jgi:UDP-2,3-diacylglucosamine pyrophosphatase LpxH